MKINDLTISAFRGLRDPVRLRLDARLTLLYSPNGTGKTSICDAVEWLLTGEVSRLHKLKKHASEGVGNIFTSDPPFVEACLEMGEAQRRFRRIGTGNDARFEGEHQGAWEPISLEHVLGQITPDNLPRLRVRQPHVSRANWLRAVRFLAPASLDLLIDDSTDAQEVRSLVFSQLFGVEEVQERETHLRKVLSQLPKGLELRSKRKEILNFIAKLIETTKQESGQHPPAPTAAQFAERIRQAARLLNAPIPDTGVGPAHQIAAITAEAAKLNAQLSQERVTLDKARREWPRYTHLVTSRSQMSDKITNLNERKKGLQGDAARIVRARDELLSRTRMEEGRARTCAESTYLELKTQLNAALRDWENVYAANDQLPDPGFLRSAIELCRKAVDQARSRIQLIQECVPEIPMWREAATRIEVIRARLLELTPPQSEAGAAFDQKMRELQENLANFDHETAQLAGPFERLKAISNELLETLPCGSRCPLCGHDHVSQDSLRAEVRRCTSEQPTMLMAREKARLKLRNALLAQEKQQQRWNAEGAERRSLNQELVKRNELLKEAAEKLGSIGLPDLELINNIAEKLQAELAEQRKALEKADVEAKGFEKRLHAAAGLTQWCERANQILNYFLWVTNQTDVLEPWEQIPPSLWPSRLEKWIGKIAACRDLALRKAKELKSLTDEKNEALTKILEQAGALEKELSDKLIALGAVEAELRAIEDTWSQAYPDTRWTEDAMEALQKRTVDRSSQVSAAQSEITAAQALHAIELVHLDRKRELVEQQRQIAEKQLELRKLRGIEKLRDDLNHAVDLLKETREAFVVKQIQPLTGVIRTIYSRSQSNALIDGISMERKGGAMHWLTEADGRKFEDPVQLSQGQRQDLALAIFLARSRGIGGTFFLDEPLSHLDDLNRVALLDVFRVLALERQGVSSHLVLTTASSALVKHFREKFSLVRTQDGDPLLRVYSLSGDPKSGVKINDLT